MSRESTPMSSAPGSILEDPFMSGTNRATTTERRTTTTTTTKRTIKSSDDFIPTSTDIQQVRSESRSGSLTSQTPVYFASGATSNQSTSGANQQQQQQQQSTTSKTTNMSSTTSSNQQHLNDAASATTTKATWNESFSSPIIQETEEGRVLKLCFDVSQYGPDEIVVKTIDNRLTVQAKHEEKSENRSVYREYNREFHLPDGTDIELIRSTLSKDGILSVECPLPTPQSLGGSRRIPIEKI